MKVLEFLRSKQCILDVLFYSSSFTEVVGDAAITFDPENEIELKDKMELLINSKNLRKNLINNGKKRIEKFSWRNCANKNYEVYAKINNE